MTYRNDPRWIVARYAGKSRDGTPFKKGDKIFFYPATQTALAGDEAMKAHLEFEGLRLDEDFYNS